MTEVIKVEDCGSNIGDYDIPIHNAIIIPKGATNGDMIKAMFPDAMKSNYIDSDNKCTLYIDDDELEVDIDWWNAPYKAESEEETADGKTSICRS